MKLFKSFKIIRDESNVLLNNIAGLTNIFAHSHEHKDYETLYNHTRLVLHYFDLLVDQHQLEPCIDRLIEEISFDDEKIGNYLKKLFIHTIIFHDIGKVNPNFQSEKLKNTCVQANNTLKIGTDHSFLSAYSYLSYHISEIFNSDINDEYTNILACYTFLFTIPILKHHSSMLEKDYEFDTEKTESIHALVNHLIGYVEADYINQFIINENRLWDFFDEYINCHGNYDFFAIYALLKLNWSLLTAADYYATSEYMNDFKTEDFGLLNRSLREKIFKNFTTCKIYNKNLVEQLDYYLSFEPKQLEKSPHNLNILRQRLGAEVWVNLEKLKDEHVFYIEAPTGGGKTNLSMIAIIRLLQFHQEINKVFYVFPFTTLITQTLKSIKETLGLSDAEIAQIHSKAEILSKDEGEIDATYGNYYKNQVDNLFVNFPFVLLTHIKFFDILKSNDKKSNYLLHRLANSIVVMDEIQAYDPKHWDRIKYFISNYAKYFNIRFIIMSATLPRVHNISISDTDVLKFHDLIENPQQNYFKNPNFCSRVQIKSDLLEKQIALNDLAEIVYKKSEDYAINRTDGLKNSVFTIIEFIFKKTATAFYEVINEKNIFLDYEIFVLSGTIIEPRRKYIIEYLKDPENRKKKILVISTQVVEAGIDIDMDLGFKNQSLIDSDEQLAGRVNRNLNKESCELYLFRYDESQRIYGKDLRYLVTQQLETDEIKYILQNKDFDSFYQKVIAEINKKNKSVYKSNFHDYQKFISSFQFNKVNSEFRLIEDATITIFVPIDIPIVCYKNEQNFSKVELNFMLNAGICSMGDTSISGKSIWDYYTDLIYNSTKVQNKTLELKLLNSIMSKFVFSLYASKINDLKPFLFYNENQHDYNFHQYYLLNSAYIGDNQIYSLESGLHDSKLKNSFELF